MWHLQHILLTLNGPPEQPRSQQLQVQLPQPLHIPHLQFQLPRPMIISLLVEGYVKSFLLLVSWHAEELMDSFALLISVFEIQI